MMVNRLLATYVMEMNHNKPISTRDTEIGYKVRKDDIFLPYFEHIVKHL